MEYRIGKEDIIRAVQHLISGTHQPFIPGETYISPHGAMLDGDDASTGIQPLLDSWLTEGKFAKDYVRQLRLYLHNQIRAVTLCNSGSSASLLAISALTSKEFGERRLFPGDEIITTAVNFPTSVNAIIQNHAVPVFVDVDLRTYVPKVEHIEEVIVEGKTKAVFLGHTLGNCFNAEAIEDLCREYKIFMISDCADAFGSMYRDRHVETYGDMATHSYYPAHMITSGEGGAVMTDNPMVKKVLDSFNSWGRSCFPAGTLINKNEKQIYIEDIRAGDKVLTHRGSYEIVTETLNRKYTGKLYTIKSNNNLDIQCTEEHPFYVLRRGEFKWVEAQALNNYDILLEALPLSWFESRLYKRFHYRTMNNEKVFDVALTPNTFRLMGYWLAEGSLSLGLKGKSGYRENKYKCYRVDFSFHEDEINYIDDVIKLMRITFGVSYSIRKQKNSKAVSLSFKTRKGYEFFKQLFGEKAWNKSIPAEFVGLDKYYINELIIGYWRGDGSSSNRHYSFSSTSPHLLNQIRRILLLQDITSSYWIRKKENHNPSTVNGQIIMAKHDSHWINIYGNSATLFREIVKDKSYGLGGKANYSWTNSRYVYNPIKSIEYEYVKDLDVYNLEVEKDHSYHANNIAVHNCWCLPGKDNTCGKRFDWCEGDLPLGYDHKYVFDKLGYNLKMTDMQAALLSSQIKKLPDFVEKRRYNFMYLDELMQEFEDWFWLPRATEHSEPSWFGYPITMKGYACSFSRNELIAFLEEHKVGTRLLFAGNILKQPAYADLIEGQDYKIHSDLYNSDIVMRDAFWLGVHPLLNESHYDYIAEVFRDFLKDKR